MKFMANIGLLSLALLFGCKDKNMDDYRLEQLQESLTRISAVSGAYSGAVTSRVDGTNLGAITLKFQAKTDIQSNNGNVSNQQNAVVSGSLKFQSVSSAEVIFSNGYYNDKTGDFQVTISIPQGPGVINKLSLSGVVSGNSWLGTIEADGQPEFAGELNLQKNSPLLHQFLHSHPAYQQICSSEYSLDLVGQRDNLFLVDIKEPHNHRLCVHNISMVH